MGLTGVIAIAAGEHHTVALKSDGTVLAWGWNSSGQLGDGGTTSRVTPVQTSNLSGVQAIAVAWNHTMAVKSDGTVWAWGWNAFGQLGDGSTTNRLTPVQVSGLTSVQAIAASEGHTVALKSDGSVWAWGANWGGQVGDGTIGNDRLTPVHVSALTGVQSIAAGSGYTVALKSDGRVWAWGWNGFAQLGDGSIASRSTPAQASNLTGMQTIAAGGDHTVALKSGGTVWAWGNNEAGQLGDGTFLNSRLTPVQVMGLTGVMAIAAGEDHTVALRSEGTVWAWGRNRSGQLGDGSTTGRFAPVQVSGLTSVQAIDADGSHTVALKSDGTVWAWGRNSFGQLGDGSTTNRSTPVQVSNLTGVQAIAAGGEHTVAALQSDGTVWAWGNNDSGQLGDGSTTSRLTPVQVSNLTGAQAVAAGWAHTVALKSGGTVWAWGSNESGQLGDGSTTDRSAPVQVMVLTGVMAIAAGGDHTVALKSDGTVWAWGANWGGQLGDGSTTNRLTPVQASNLSGVQAIAAGAGHTLALKSDGTVWAWGWNSSGPLGADPTWPPVQVVNFDAGVGHDDVVLNVTVGGPGTVTSDPQSIACGDASPDCTGAFATGTSVRLFATPAAGALFNGWSGACAGTATCTVTMDAAKNVTATFTQKSYPITVTASPVAGGSVSCAPNPVSHGATSTCTATANAGYVFSTFSGDCVGSSCSLSNVTGPQSIVATFAASTSRLTVARRGTGIGRVAAAPAVIDCGPNAVWIFRQTPS